MEVRIHYYALLRDMAGVSEEIVTLAEGSDGNDLLAAVAARHPGMQKLLHVVRLASETEYLRRDDALRPGAAVQLIPPVSGG
jgi:molybdopterin converting factor small subunit